MRIGHSQERAGGTRLWVISHRYRVVLAFVGLVALPLRADAETAATAGQSPNECLSGTSSAGWCGDGGPATAAKLRSPWGVAVGPDGRTYVADAGNHVVRVIERDGTIHTRAGTGVAGYTGDGGRALIARLDRPVAVAVDGARLLVADAGTHTVRSIEGPLITTVAGTGRAGFSGDGQPGRQAALNSPYGIAVTEDGGFLIADRGNNRIRKILPDGTIKTVAGNGRRGYSGDGGSAVLASLSSPYDVSPTGDGGFLVADTSNNRVRMVSPAGVISTVVGTGRATNSGDGGPGNRASIEAPLGVHALLRGALVATAGEVLRRVGTTGTIRSVATVCATDVAQNADRDGFLVGVPRKDRVLEVTPAGRIVTIAGSGESGAGTCKIQRSPVGGSPLWDVFALRDSVIHGKPRKLTVRWMTSRSTERLFTITRAQTSSIRPCTAEGTQVWAGQWRFAVAGKWERTLYLDHNLAPGTYTLRLRGRRSDGLTNCDETKLEIQ
jgi:hypothetical protein